MRRAALLLAMASLIAIGCDATIPASLQPQPLGSLSQAGTSPSSPDPAASPSREASPSPTTVDELAALYSKALATANKADEKDAALWIKSSKNLDAAKARSRRRARATLTFLRTVRELPWPSDLEPIARRLVKCNNTVYVYEKHASNGKSYEALNGRAAVNKYNALARRMGAKCTVLANKLRHELGLDPPIEALGCTLLWYDGYLVADNGRAILAESQGDRSGTPLIWPDGWTVRAIDDEQLEIVDLTGTVRARTGEGIVLSMVGGNDPPGTALFRDGGMVVCPDHWPANYMDPNYVPPDPDIGDAP